MIKLLSTDFDGTLIGHHADARTAAALSTVLQELRESGAVWAVNTGRQLWFALEGLEQAHFPHDPEYMLSSEKDIFRRAEKGRWEAFGDWNMRTEVCTGDLLDRAADFVEKMREMSARENGVELLYENGRVSGVMTADNATMDRIVAMIGRVQKDVPEFSFNRNDVWMRFAHCEIHKGAALAELASKLGIARESVFAIGDNHNDLSMLDGEVAGMVACPSNAVEEVKETVRAAGGYVSSLPWGEGVADAIRHFSKSEGN